jgi:hypothetical protein
MEMRYSEKLRTFLPVTPENKEFLEPVTIDLSKKSHLELKTMVKDLGILVNSNKKIDLLDALYNFYGKN